jgi:hypothetical protein
VLVERIRTGIIGEGVWGVRSRPMPVACGHRSGAAVGHDDQPCGSVCFIRSSSGFLACRAGSLVGVQSPRAEPRRCHHAPLRGLGALDALQPACSGRRELTSMTAAGSRPDELFLSRYPRNAQATVTGPLRRQAARGGRRRRARGGRRRRARNRPAGRSDRRDPIFRAQGPAAFSSTTAGNEGPRCRTPGRASGSDRTRHAASRRRAVTPMITGAAARQHARSLASEAQRGPQPGRRRCQGRPATSGWVTGRPISSISPRTTSSRTAITMTTTAVGWPQNTKISAARATAEMRSPLRCA